MLSKVSRNLTSVRSLCLIVVASLLAVGLLHLATGYGDQLPDRSLTIANPTISASTTYKLNFTLAHQQNLGSIKLQFCKESPLVGTPCTKPVGIDASAVVLAAQSGETGFTVSPLSDDSTIILARTSSPPTTTTNLAYELNTIVNPSGNGTFYARLQTFTTLNATGASTDEGGMALATDDAVSVSATVPPYLYFCLGISVTGVDCSTATGFYLNYGEFSPAIASVASTQMVAGTNGPTGYYIVMNGTTLTSGNDVIPALTTQDVSRPGTSQFGVNLRANTDPAIGQEASGGGAGLPVAGYNVANQYKFVPGDIVASAPVPDLPRRYTTSYIANIAKSQVPGVYVSTITYVATAGF